jgi:hypothetical protein
VDGSIAFWAVEDDEQPLMVRTLDEVDVHKVDGEKLGQYLDDEDTPKPARKVHEPREPIFKLAWSGYPNSYDPRGGETSLVILGGQFGRDLSGVNVLWLPAFNPPAPPSSKIQHSLHPFFRNAMRESLDPLSAYFYRTPGLVQDFLLMPRDNPHFCGVWNPTTILVLFESGEHVRAVEARQFPPLEFLASAQEASQSAEQAEAKEGDDQDALSKNFATILQSMSINEEPKKFNLPPSLWSGTDAIVDADIFLLDRIAYETLSRANDHESNDLLLEGGISEPDDEISGAIKYAKVITDQPTRCQSNLVSHSVRTPSYRCHAERRSYHTLPGHICATPYPYVAFSLHVGIPSRSSSPLCRCPRSCLFTRNRNETPARFHGESTD